MQLIDGRVTSAVEANDGEFVWMGDGLRPPQDELDRAVRALRAVPLAGAAGWSARGRRWSPSRPLRRAVVSPGATLRVPAGAPVGAPDATTSGLVQPWEAVREVDCLLGVIVVRRKHLARVDIGVDSRHSEVESAATVSRALRRGGFRLLLLGQV